MLQNIKTFLYLGQKGRGRLVRLCVQWSHPIVPTMGGWGGGTWSDVHKCVVYKLHDHSGKSYGR